MVFHPSDSTDHLTFRRRTIPRWKSLKPRSRWTGESSTTKRKIAGKDGRVVAITCTVKGGEINGAPAFEFCWLPVDDADLVDVYFGVSPETGSAWDIRWDRARKATEWEVATRAQG